MSKTAIFITAFLCLTLSPAKAQSWLPKQRNPEVSIRLLGCIYDGSRLKECTQIGPDSDDWKVEAVPDTEYGGIQYVFEAKRPMQSAGVAVAFDEYDWCSDNYVMIPAVVYNGNRQRIVNRDYATGLDKSDFHRRDLALTSNPIPQLSPEFGARSRVEVNVSNTTTPVIAYYDRKGKHGTFLFTDQGIDWKNEVKDHAFIVEESWDRSVASFVISAPGVRELKPEFIGFCPSPDRGLDFQPGDRVVIRVARIENDSDDLPAFLSCFMKERKRHCIQTDPRNLVPMSEVLSIMNRNIDGRYLEGDKWQYYCPEAADWMAYGWIGGLINTYPMLVLGDEFHLKRVMNTFDFALLRGYGASGYFYDTIGADGEVLNRDAAKLNPGIGLTRRNADLLYWLVKQFNLLKKQGKSSCILPEYENRAKALADAFTRTWQKEGTWGNYLDVESGDVAVYNTTSGVMAVGGMALASEYFHNSLYLDIARQSAAYYYDSFSKLGFTSGGCGDILQNADSETAASFMTALMTLYEVTGDKTYLKQSEDLANLFATWVVSFPYHLPEDTPLAKLGANLTGAVWASTQNKHAAPGSCTQSLDALFKLYRATENEIYAELLRDVIHAYTEGIQPNGKITERLTYCDADSRGSRADGWETGWTETNGALMAIEIPGIYIRKDTGKIYVFDHVEVTPLFKNGTITKLSVHNPTKFDAAVTVMSENGTQAGVPLGDNAYTNWAQKIKVKAGSTVTFKID